MPSHGHVHWHEGLFLQPHHLQTMQRRAQESVWDERRLGMAWPTGLIEARISSDALENMLVRFDRLRAIMPSGQEVWFPETSDLPPLDIKKAFEGTTQPFVVELGVPLWYATRGNAIEQSGAGGAPPPDWRVKRLYRVAETPRPDENTGENTQPVLIRRTNARLLLPGDDRTDLETLPLVRVAHATGEDSGKPRIDPAFVPPCLVLGGSPTLREFIRDLSNQVEASRRDLAGQVGRGGFSFDTIRGVQFEQLLRLRTLNRFAGSLPSLVVAPNSTPFALYLQLRELLGELAALSPHRDRELFEVAPYDHANPMPSFRDLADRIRELLVGSVAPSYLKLPFRREESILVATMTEEHLSRPSDYFLGIQTREDPVGLARLVENPDEFKLAAKSMVHNRVFGVKLTWERQPPLSLPPTTGLHYFRLGRAESQRMWEKISQEREVALRWLGVDTADYQVSLYMPVPDGAGGNVGAAGGGR